MEETRELIAVDNNKQTDVLKAARRHFSSLGGRFIIGTVIIFAVQLSASGIVRAVKPEWLYDPDTVMLISMLPMYLVGMPALILLVWRLPGQKPERRRMTPGQFGLAAFMCFSVMYVLNFAGIILTTSIGLLRGEAVQNTIVDIASTVSPLTAFFYMVICAPVMEELIFRKLIVDRTIRYGQGVAVAVSGLMFGLFHGNLNQFVYAFGLGAFLAFLYAKTGNLKITIGMHMLVNFFGSIVSLAVMNLIDLEGLMELEAAGMQPDALMAYLSENITGWLVYMMYIFLMLAVMITGGVLWIIALVKKRFVMEKGEVVIPKGKRFRTVILNVGMGIYCIAWIGMIIYQLFA